jgi:hypothetical protein
MGRKRKLTPEIARKIVPVNPSDASYEDHRFIFYFSTGGFAQPIYLMAWGRMEDALEKCVDWIIDNAPGILCDDEVEAEYKRLVAEGMDEEEAQQEAEVDTTCFGHNGYHCIPSENWGIVKEDPSRADILDIQGRPAEHRARGADLLAKKMRRSFGKRRW